MNYQLDNTHRVILSLIAMGATLYILNVDISKENTYHSSYTGSVLSSPINKSNSLSSISGNTEDQEEKVEFKSIDPEDYIFLTEDNSYGVFLTKRSSKKQVLFYEGKMSSIQLSPSRNKMVFFVDHYDSQFNYNSLILYDISTKNFRELYTGLFSYQVRGHVHWLGDNHIFFKSVCGTGCQGISLLNIDSLETKNATLNFAPILGFLEKGTLFEDWFDKDFRFDETVTDVLSERKDGKEYLILTLEDENNNYVGEKKLLFNGDSLTLVE